MNITNLKNSIPEYVLRVGQTLQRHNFQAYLVGGSVRDLVMGRDAKDYDIATNATPAEMEKIFKKAILTGAKFGAVIVLVDDEQGESHSVDVTTFRVEQYLQGRWPSNVTFVGDIKEDLARRDFTLNAMAFDLSYWTTGSQGANILLDLFNGQKDIQLKIVRAVGDPNERLREDALRALRACRFSSVLGFQLDTKLKEAIESVLPMIDDLSAERVRDEFVKIIYDSPKPSLGLRLLEDTGILKIWIPELLEGVGVDQPEFHSYDVFEHALRAVDHAEDGVKLAALFHDIGKPRTKEGGHFYRHDVVGAEMTEEIMKRLHFPNREIRRVSTLVRWHMFYFPYDEEAYQKGQKFTEKELEARKHIAKWGDSAVRRFVRNVGGAEEVDELIKLRIADATSNPKSIWDSREIKALQKRITEVRAKDMALKITDLDISGHELKKLGIQAGPRMGEILNELLEMVLEDPSINDKHTLLHIVKEKFLQSEKKI